MEGWAVGSFHVLQKQRAALEGSEASHSPSARDTQAFIQEEKGTL